MSAQTFSKNDFRRGRASTDNKDVQFICHWGSTTTPNVRKMEEITGWRFVKGHDGTIKVFVPRSIAGTLSVGCPVEFAFGTLHVDKRIA